MTINAKDIKPGTRIGANYGAGCGEAWGTAYGRTNSRWGWSCRVKLDDGTFTAIMSADLVQLRPNEAPELAIMRVPRIGSYIFRP